MLNQLNQLNTWLNNAPLISKIIFGIVFCSFTFKIGCKLGK